MVWTLGLSFLLEWERLSLFGHYGYVEMKRFLMIKFFYYVVDLRSDHGPPTAFGGSRPFFRGVFTARDCSGGVVFTAWMAV